MEFEYGSVARKHRLKIPDDAAVRPRSLDGADFVFAVPG